MKKVFYSVIIFITVMMFSSTQVSARTFREATAENPYKIVAIGDSITYSATYAAILDQLENCTVENLGNSGTQVAGKADHSFVNRTRKLKTDADMILILGGTNDYRGVMDMQNDLGAENSTNITTFYGAYNTMIKNLKKRNPNTKIVLITPIKRCYGYEPNTYGYSLAHYAQATQIIAANNGLDCIDLYNDKNCDFTENDLLIDGLHPNQEGHKIIAEEILRYISIKDL